RLEGGARVRDPGDCEARVGVILKLLEGDRAGAEGEMDVGIHEPRKDGAASEDEPLGRGWQALVAVSDEPHRDDALALDRDERPLERGTARAVRHAISQKKKPVGRLHRICSARLRSVSHRTSSSAWHWYTTVALCDRIRPCQATSDRCSGGRAQFGN